MARKPFELPSFHQRGILATSKTFLSGKIHESRAMWESLWVVALLNSLQYFLRCRISSQPSIYLFFRKTSDVRTSKAFIVRLLALNRCILFSICPSEFLHFQSLVFWCSMMVNWIFETVTNFENRKHLELPSAVTGDNSSSFCYLSWYLWSGVRTVQTSRQNEPVKVKIAELGMGGEHWSHSMPLRARAAPAS